MLTAARALPLSRPAVLLLTALGLGVPLPAAVGWWSSQGPEGGAIEDIALLGGTKLLAASAGGVVRSVDAGATWVLCNQGAFAGASALAVDPTDPGRVYQVGPSIGVVFASEDGGRTWTVHSFGNYFSAQSLAVAASDSARLYAGGYPQQGSSSLVLASDDGGLTWHDRSAGLVGADSIEDLVVDPGDADHVWGVAWDGQLYETSSGGASWAPAGAPGTVVSLAWDAARGELAAATEDGVWHRTGDGSWSSWGLGGQQVQAVATDATDPLRLWAATEHGLARSLDGGVSWQARSPDGLRAQVLRLGDAGEVWAATASGMWRSLDDGASWAAANGGLIATVARSLATVPGERGVYATADGVGLTVSRDGGSSWSHLGPAQEVSQAVLVVPPSGDLYLGGSGSYVSRDHGATWSWLAELDATNAWALGGDGAYLFAGSEYDGLWRSGDDGASFVPVGAGLPSDAAIQALAADASGAGLWLGTRDGIYRSEDDGATVSELSTGLGNRTVTALLVVPLTGVAFAATDDGVYRFAAGHWQRVYAQRTTSLAVAADGTLYAASYGAILASRDGGTGWLALGASPPAWVIALAVDGADANRLYAGTYGSGVLEIDLSAPATFMTSPTLPGFRASVRITTAAGAVQGTAQESDCIPETICVSGALHGRSELFLRVVGPKPNGYLWPTIVKFSTSQIEVWLEQLSTGIVRTYLLPAASPDSTDLAGFYDRLGFEP